MATFNGYMTKTFIKLPDMQSDLFTRLGELLSQEKGLDEMALILRSTIDHHQDELARNITERFKLRNDICQATLDLHAAIREGA